LSRETREKILYFLRYTTSEKPRENRYIRLYAGYNDGSKQATQIFSGNVIHSTVSTPPDIWVDMECIAAFPATTKNYSISYDGNFPASSIIFNVCQEMGLGFIPLASEDGRTFANFSFNGSGFELIKKLYHLRIEDWVLWYDGFNIYTADRKATHLTAEKSIDGGHANLWEINSKNGMIGIPKFDIPYSSVRTLLNSMARAGDYANIISEMYPKGNGLYRIIEVVHSGELRGNDFYTDYKLVAAN
jgi:hypothetical protein